jgi:hypothetical protein
MLTLDLPTEPYWLDLPRGVPLDPTPEHPNTSSG